MAASDAALDRWVKKYQVIEETSTKWKPVGLAALQSTMERDASDILQRKEAVSEGRKVVSTRTKEFAKMSTEEKVGQVGSILKLYQGYIDDVSKQLKYAQELYLDTHKVVGLMVDPVPLLSRLLSDKPLVLEMVKAAEELDRVKRDLGDREAELGELKNQEITIQQLREELAAAEYGQEEQLQQAVEEDAMEAKSVLRQWQQREQQLQQDITQMSQECRKFQIQAIEQAKQVGLERTALMEFQAVKETEVEGLLSDIDALSTQLAVTERDQARLRQAQVDQAEGWGELENKLLDCQEVLDTKVTALMKLEVALKTTEQERQALAKKVAEQQSTPASSGVDQDALAEEQKEQQRAQEVGRLRAGHFQELEKLQAELLGARNEAQSLRLELGNALAQVQASKKESSDLEKELRQVMLATTPSGGRAGPIVNSATAVDGDNGGAPGKPTGEPTTPTGFDLASVLGDINVSARAGGGEDSGAPQDALSAVVTQRDRYRQRLIALEESSRREADALKLQVFNATQENEQLHQYLRNGGLASAGSGTPQSFAIRMPGSHSSVVIGTSLLDRMAQVMTKFILTNDITRRIFLMYLLALHGLVFLVLAAQTFHF